MKPIAFAIVATVTATTARADTPTAYGGADVIAGAGGMATDLALPVMDGVGVSAGYALSPMLWLRGSARYLRISEVDGDGRGTTRQVRAGVEARVCNATGLVCGRYGLAVGYQDARWTNDNNDVPMGVFHGGTFEAVVAVPEVAIDLGGATRVRLAFEMDGVIVLGDHRTDPARADLLDSLGCLITLGAMQEW